MHPEGKDTRQPLYGFVSDALQVARQRRAERIEGATQAADLLRYLPDTMRAVRQQRGLSVPIAAREAGVSNTHWYDVEAGRHSFSVPFAIKVLRWLAP